MIELLNSNLETAELYLKPLKKYFNKTCIKLEDQVKHRKAARLIEVRDFIITREFYERDSETLIELRKTYTDKKEHVFCSISWLKRKDRFLLQHRLRQEKLRDWRSFLVNEYQSINVCYV